LRRDHRRHYRSTSRFSSLFVIAQNSSFTYRGKVVDLKQVGRDLGVRYVLEGSVRKASNRVRITAQLIQVDTGANLWLTATTATSTISLSCRTTFPDASSERLLRKSDWPSNRASVACPRGPARL